MNNLTQQQGPMPNIQPNLPNQQNIELTTAEIGTLWATYMANSMLKCVYSYFVQRSTDPSIQPLLQYALDLCTNHMQAVANIFSSSNNTIPYGFTEADVDLTAKLLFSETFMLSYTRFTGRYALSQYSSALTIVARQDVRDFFASAINSSTDLYNKTTNLLLQKGLLIRAPYGAVSTEIEFVSKHRFISGFWGDKRPLNCLEIAYLYNSVQTNHIGKTICLGFSQAAKSKTVKDYSKKGKQIADQHVEVFSNFLKEDDITAPMTWDDHVTDSVEAPFSDKLIMFHLTTLSGYGISQYGIAMTNSMRTDLVTAYTRLIAESMGYAKDGLDIMIENAWLEKVPQVADREKLSM